MFTKILWVVFFFMVMTGLTLLLVPTMLSQPDTVANLGGVVVMFLYIWLMVKYLPFLAKWATKEK